jgi:hypothetical protein
MPYQRLTSSYHMKPLNTNKNSYNQSFQYQKDLEKAKEGTKINPKKIFENVEKKSVKKKRVQKKKY